MTTYSETNPLEFLAQYTPEVNREEPDPNQITFAQVGTNRVVASADDIAKLNSGRNTAKKHHKDRMFEPVPLRKNKGPLIIHGKRWYFRLVQKVGSYRRARALMEDFKLNDIAEHMVVCFTPDRIPTQDRPFRNKDGNPIRIYAFFDSYLEFYEYKEKFKEEERSFFEVVFGELPQKPHFDIDMEVGEFQALYPGEDIDLAAETVREAVISGCIKVLEENMVTLSMEKDVLLYSSHGDEKRSYHVVINNKCHDGNEEAKAFYDAVVEKARIETNGKYLEFIDRSVYSPRQQFRLAGCQKWGSGRPKVFYEHFTYRGRSYTHEYGEDVTEPIMKKLTVLYESMVSFCSGCVYLPSLIPPKVFNQNDLGDLPDLEGDVVRQCISMLRDKMELSLRELGVRRNFCPFSLREVQGHLILLKRDAASFCPICNKEHGAEHPYIFMVSGKVYWDCRRSHEYAGGKKLFLGYLAMTLDEMLSNPVSQDHLNSFMQTGSATPDLLDDSQSDEEGVFMFGDYDIGLPTLPPVVRTSSPAANTRNLQTTPTFAPTTVLNNNHDIQGEGPIIYTPPPEARMQNLSSNIAAIQKKWAEQKYLRREPEDIAGVRSLSSVTPQMQWAPGHPKR